MARFHAFAAMAAVLLCACVAPAQTQGTLPSPAAAAAPASSANTPAAPAAPGRTASMPHYRCDQGMEFDVRFADDTAVIDAGAQGKETLLRDAGGATPQQSVYSNERLRAEFGLGVTAKESMLHYTQPPRALHCVQQ
jgi:hypothetical protein